ncbi:sigma-70 family RNA polymerase sigma factor [Agathobaculum sp. NTUH-O15-33]|uniref:RNA polymerase sigma factor n=1 Tax=Agathobaculum sp. NTUH-O15-33 TaxID=3079302 RepID=UPI00295842AA|nr:sigma-70 family RNA polymerase sigma factor [Agathobaculum sp. NTUH-O15-33]WNX83495.1 sigma-70 family RNA polymerase sigma factor [Agathobaculum sp. NTUH-O15-33]
MAEDRSLRPDPEMIPQLLDTYGDRLLRLCTLYLRDIHLAEDALQDTMLRAWRARDTFRGDSGAATWITHIAVNVCRDYLRSPWKRRRAPAEELDTLFAPADDPQVDDTLPHAVMSLSRPLREVVILYYYQELKAREIADMLHLPISTVTARLSRAREQLRHTLKGWYYDEE